MNLFLDANILIAVCNKEYPLFPFAARILSLADQKNMQLFTSPLCMAITYYFVEKKSDGSKARQKMILLAQKIKFTDNRAEDVVEVCKNKTMHDFEDGLQYLSAVRSKCNFIITQDTNDFYFSDIPAIRAEDFLKVLKQ
ncbi:MAG: PIN domain-containing protein [Chitinophagaceae bacterium]|jgi:predicted nucleic acid-binding protein|nr:PIN domain-containing protein [Chitinophagaceae bacterium]